MKKAEARQVAERIGNVVREIARENRSLARDSVAVSWDRFPPGTDDFLSRWGDLAWGYLPLGATWKDFTDQGFTLVFRR